MCSVNDKKRDAIQLKINEYESKKMDLEEMKVKVEKALYENIDALTYANCVTKNLFEVDLGGKKTIDSLKECEDVITSRKNFFEVQLDNIKVSLEKIKNAIILARFDYDSIPDNCGVCSECCPPKQTEDI